METTGMFEVGEVRFAAAGVADRKTGLLGFVIFTLGGRLRVDGVAVRRTRDGRLALSYPRRTDRSGDEHHVVKPLDDATRRDIERQVFAALAGSIGNG